MKYFQVRGDKNAPFLEDAQDLPFYQLIFICFIALVILFTVLSFEPI